MQDTSRKSARGMRTRDSILATALDLFTQRGYFNTSIHDIRAVSGISIGSIYHHFSGKEDIAAALYEEVVADMAAMVDEACEQAQSAAARCQHVLRSLLMATEQAPERMHFVLYARHREFMPEQKPICSSAPFERLRQIVEEGISAGEFRGGDSWVIASTLFGGVIRLIQLHLDGVIQGPMGGYADSLWDSAMNGVSRAGR